MISFFSSFPLALFLFTVALSIALSLAHQSLFYHIKKYFPQTRKFLRSFTLNSSSLPIIDFSDALKANAVAHMKSNPTHFTNTLMGKHNGKGGEIKETKEISESKENKTNSSSPSSSLPSSDWSVLPSEISKFSAMSSLWWSLEGPFGSLHKMNSVRTQFIALQINKFKQKNYQTEVSAVSPREALSGLSILDVGCGGGILSDALCRVGAKVTAIDAAEMNIQRAKEHYQQVTLKDIKESPHPSGSIEFLHVTSESLLMSSPNVQYDVVCSLEVIEHLDKQREFIGTLCALTKKGGHLFVSTLNRSVWSYLLGILCGEYILRMTPIGTHEWGKFVRPEEILQMAKSAEKSMGEGRGGEMKLQCVSGMVFTPLLDQWDLDENTQVNYILHFIKQ